MTIGKLITKKFKTLLDEGRGLLQRSGWNGHDYQSSVDDVAYMRFRTEPFTMCPNNALQPVPSRFARGFPRSLGTAERNR